MSSRRNDQAHVIELRKAIKQYAKKALGIDKWIRSLGDKITLLVKNELTSSVMDFYHACEKIMDSIKDMRISSPAGSLGNETGRV